MILLFILSIQAVAYEGLFNMNSAYQLREFQLKRDQKLWLREKCELDKQRGALLWACYLSTHSKMTSNEMASDCRLKTKYIQNIELIPDEKYIKNLPQDCQLVLSRQRQVLAYKAKGI